MKEMFERPAVFYGAQTKKGFNIVVEILQFLLVLIIGAMLEGLFTAPFIAISLFRNKEFMNIVRNYDFSSVETFVNQLMSSNRFAILNLFATAVMIVVVFVFCKCIQRRRLSSLGFRKKGFVIEYVLGAVIGFVIFSVAVLICIITGAVKINGYALHGAWAGLLLILVGYIIQGMSEEVMLRGYLMVSIARRNSLTAAIITNSVVFACMHLINPGIAPLALVNLFLFGVFASLYFVKRGSIWGVAAVHSIWNFVQGNFYGISVSGTNSGSSLFSTSFIPGHTLLNGGEFGLEGGLGVTIVLVIGIVILYFIKGNVDQQEIEQEKQRVEHENLKVEQEKQNIYNGMA